MRNLQHTTGDSLNRTMRAWVCACVCACLCTCVCGHANRSGLIKRIQKPVSKQLLSQLSSAFRFGSLTLESLLRTSQFSLCLTLSHSFGTYESPRASSYQVAEQTRSVLVFQALISPNHSRHNSSFCLGRPQELSGSIKNKSSSGILPFIRFSH